MNRIDRLKQKLFAMDDRTIFLERLEILKISAQKYAGETAGMCFGHTLNELLSNISVVIDPDDLIVGRINEIIPTTDQEADFYGSQHYWRPAWFCATGGTTISWETLLKLGLNGIKKKASNRLSQITDNNPESLIQKDFLTGVMLCCDAIITLANRYAQKAEDLAEEICCSEGTDEHNRQRQAELRGIAEVCRRVPVFPPNTFHEAIQAIWFVDIVLHAVAGARDFALGRLDQYLYPFYADDFRKGRITSEKALELLQCLFIKCNELIGLADYQDAKKRSLCYDSVQYLVLGGQTNDGRDATNPLSFLCIEAGKMKLKQPMLVIRYFDDIDKNFFRQACGLARYGGSVSIYNDGTVIPALLNLGVDMEEARGYVYRGCCNPSIAGKDGSLMMSWHNLPKYLALTLFDGSKFQSFAELFEAFVKQMRYALSSEFARYKHSASKDDQQYTFSLESCFLEGCIENARDWQVGGTKYAHVMHVACAGIATVADSLAAIKKIVFEDKEMSLSELREILSSNFEGNEPLRQKLINRYPKFGNDDDYVDSLAREVCRIFCEEVVKYNNGNYLVRFWPKIYSHLFNRPMGKNTGATPDGRMKGEPISENQSPAYGADKSGVTACLNSMSKLPFSLAPGGGTNLTIHPSMVAGESGIDVLSHLVEGYFQRGGMHLHINVIDKSTLEDAQRYPEKYSTLSVRVTGYSAYFVQLNKDIQVDIIARTEHIY